MEGKPAIKSKTMNGLALAALGLLLPVVLRKLGVSDAGDIAIMKEATIELIEIGFTAAGTVGLLLAAYGRKTAKGPITGVVKAPPPVDPPADLEGLF
jgi:hypothetical protein